MINDKAVYEFLDAHSLRCGVNERYMDMSSELGELGKELLKATDYGTKPFERTPDTCSELGDCLFSLIALSCELGIDPADALTGAINKYEARLADKGSAGSGR